MFAVQVVNTVSSSRPAISPKPIPPLAVDTKAAATATGEKSTTRYQAESEPTLGTIGRFQLKATIGHGGFGRVYRAYDPQLDRQVALKVPKFAPEEERKIRRFLIEAKAAAGLRHPNNGPVSAVDPSPDGRTVVTGSYDNTVQLWDLQTQEKISSPFFHNSSVQSVEFTADGESVVSSSHADGDVRFWKVPLPIEGTAEQLTAWIESMTGVEMESDGVLHHLIPISINNCATGSVVALYSQGLTKHATRRQIRGCV